MTAMPALAALREATKTVDAALRAADIQLKTDLAAKAAAKKQRTALDALEEKVMAMTALAAAAAGTPEQAKAMLAKARAKAMRAAADGADTGSLEVMVRQMEHLAKIAEQNRNRKDKGRGDASAAVIPTLVAIAKA